MALVVGQLVWARIQGINKTSRRPCVVVATSGTTVEVVYGQGTPWPGCSKPVEVKQGSLLGQRFGLTKDTHFCDWQVLPLAHVEKITSHTCPPSQFPKFEAIAIEARLKVARAAGMKPTQVVSRRIVVAAPNPKAASATPAATPASATPDDDPERE